MSTWSQSGALTTHQTVICLFYVCLNRRSLNMLHSWHLPEQRWSHCLLTMTQVNIVAFENPFICHEVRTVALNLPSRRVLVCSAYLAFSPYSSTAEESLQGEPRVVFSLPSNKPLIPHKHCKCRSPQSNRPLWCCEKSCATAAWLWAPVKVFDPLSLLKRHVQACPTRTTCLAQPGRECVCVGWHVSRTYFCLPSEPLKHCA